MVETEAMDDLILDHRIASYECGADMLLKPSGFLHFCQEVAEMHADRHGLGFEWGLSHGLIWVEVQGDFEFLRRPRWKERVTLRTNTGKASPLQARRFVEMCDEAGQTLARADLMWVLIDVKSRRPTPFRKAELELPDSPAPICSPPDAEAAALAAAAEPQCCSLVATQRDVDFNGHINNASYLIWVLDTLPGDLRPDGELRRVHVAFRHETMAGTPLDITHRVAGKAGHHEISGEGRLRAALDLLWL